MPSGKDGIIELGLRPPDRPARRDNTLGSLTPTIHTQHVWSLKYSHIFVSQIRPALVKFDLGYRNSLSRKCISQCRLVSDSVMTRTEIFSITEPLWGESIGNRRIPFPKASDLELWYFIWCQPEQVIELTADYWWFHTTWHLYDVTVRPGLGVNKAPFINFSVSEIFNLVEVPLRFFESHSCLTGITAAEQRRHLSNMNVICNS